MLARIEAPFWDDKPVAIVAGGASLAGFDYGRLSSFYVLAVKGSIFDVPRADAGFGLDFPRYKEWQQAGKFNALKFPIYWAFAARQMSEVKIVNNVLPLLRLEDTDKFSERDDAVTVGGSSGWGALNVACLKRAKQIVLLGYDYGGMEGVWHHNEQHYAAKRQQHDHNWRAWAYNFDHVLPQLKRDGVEVVNASPHSRITAFQRMTIDDTIQYFHRV